MQQQMILPPAWIGILGGGQLGMMLASVAKQFGYQVAVLEPDPNCPAKRFADKHLCCAYDDEVALSQLAEQCAVITTEFENIPANSVRFLNKTTPVYPSADALVIAQNRVKEKTFCQSIGLKTADFAVINSAEDCNNLADNLFPAILKTTTLGYDGKGQQRVNSPQDLANAYNDLGGGECILEQRVELAQEVSIIVARNQHGIKSYPLIENIHRNGILDISYIPADTTLSIMSQAQQAAHLLIEKLDYIGLLTIEFFIDTAGNLLINEIAPRPHNSGHITIEAATTSQFEQQLRAVCGLELGECDLLSSGAMLNLLGEVWLNNSQANEILLNYNPQAKFHWYGKTQAKIGRKMGHISLCAESRTKLECEINNLKSKLNLA